MSRFNRNKVPQYIQDLENGRFGEVIEDDGNEIFAYYINSETGRTDAITTSKQRSMSRIDVE